MSRVTGNLDRAYQNDAGYYSVQVDGDWYGTYKTDWSKFENQTVEFEYITKGNFKNVKGDLTTVGGGSAAAARAAPGAPNAKQASIVLQSSYKSASELVSGLVAGGNVALGAKGAAFDNAVGLMDQLALHIYERVCDKNVLDVVAGEEEVDPSAPPASDFKPTEA